MSRKRQRSLEDEEALQHIRERVAHFLRRDRDAPPPPPPPPPVEEELAVRAPMQLVEEQPAMEQPAVQTTRNVYQHELRDIVAVFRTLQTSIPESKLYVTRSHELTWQAHVVGNSTIHITVSFEFAFQNKWNKLNNEFKQETEGIPRIYSQDRLPPPPPSTTNRYYLWEDVMDILHNEFNPDNHYVRVDRVKPRWWEPCYHPRVVPYPAIALPWDPCEFMQAKTTPPLVKDSIEALCRYKFIQLGLYYELGGCINKLLVVLLNPTKCIDLWYPGIGSDCETVCTRLLQPFLSPYTHEQVELVANATSARLPHEMMRNISEYMRRVRRGGRRKSCRRRQRRRRATLRRKSTIHNYYLL